jgi:MMP 1-O-methyltransferase
MKPIIKEVRKLTAGIDGWLTEDEGELLFNLAKRCTGSGAIVEVGSWKGKSTIWLGKGSLVGSKVKVWAVDPHTGSGEHHRYLGSVWTFDDFKRNINTAGLNGVVAPLVARSADAAGNFPEPIELVFIDGAHDYASVKADFELWFPKVIEGGIVAFHDTTFWDGPRRIVLETLCASRQFGGVRLVGSIAYARKVRQNSIQDRVRNRLMAGIIGYSIALRRVLPGPMKLLLRKAVGTGGIFR